MLIMRNNLNFLGEIISPFCSIQMEYMKTFDHQSINYFHVFCMSTSTCKNSMNVSSCSDSKLKPL